tara:strand:- start:530 stop:799 length:270 start_codon:yes stop_codon:yes gene_type:complete
MFILLSLARHINQRVIATKTWKKKMGCIPITNARNKVDPSAGIVNIAEAINKPSQILDLTSSILSLSLKVAFFLNIDRKLKVGFCEIIN